MSTDSFGQGWILEALNARTSAGSVFLTPFEAMALDDTLHSIKSSLHLLSSPKPVYRMQERTSEP